MKLNRIREIIRVRTVSRSLNDWTEFRAITNIEELSTTPAVYKMRSDFTWTVFGIVEKTCEKEFLDYSARAVHSAIHGKTIKRLLALKHNLHYMSKKDVSDFIDELIASID